jgi:hypothetical protein
MLILKVIYRNGQPESDVEQIEMQGPSTPTENQQAEKILGGPSAAASQDRHYKKRKTRSNDRMKSKKDELNERTV